MSQSSPDVEVLLEHTRGLRAVARALLRDDSQVDDVLQDTWVAALRARPDASRPLGGWLAQVARNFALMRRRSTRRRRAHEQRAARSGAAPSASDLVARFETQRLVARTVAALDEPYRSTILLRYFDGLTPAEIAARTGTPAGTVRSRLKRGRELLRERLDREHGGDPRVCLLALAAIAGLSEGAALSDVASRMAALAGSVLVVALVVVVGALVWQAARDGDAPARHERATAPTPAGGDRAAVEAIPSEPVRRVAVEGTVIDESGAGMAGARVAVVREATSRYGLADWIEALELAMDPPAPVAETRADEHGRFRLELPAGSLDAVVATADGYGVASLVGLDLAEGASDVVLRLAPDALLRGRVVDTSSAPIAGAEVRLWGAASIGRMAATTGADGRFEIAGTAGSHHVAVDHPDYVGMSFWQVGLPADRIVFTLEKGAPLEGIVRRLDRREPLGGVEVIVYDGQNDVGPLPQRARSGADGRFRFERLPTRGHFAVFVDGGPHGRLAAGALSWDDRWKLEEILLGGTRVEGRVVRRRGDAFEGVAGVRVLVVDRASGFGLKGIGATSGPGGRFAVEGAGTGASALLDPRERGLAQLPYDEPMRVEVVDPVTIRGRVVDDAGAPVAGALVGGPIRGGGGNAVSGMDGGFVLRRVAPGAELWVRADGHGHANGRASDGMQLVLRRRHRPAARGASSVWGTVVDRDGAPLLGVAVELSGQRVIARRGRYEFDGLGEGPLKIVASRDGFTTARLENVRARPGGVELPPLVLVEEAGPAPAPEPPEPPEPPRGTHAIEGVVLDKHGRPRLLATVEYTGPAGELGRAGAGLNGRFRLSGLVPGAYSLEARATRTHVYEPVVVDAGSCGVVLRPRLGATIEGRVVGIEPGDGPFYVSVAKGWFGTKTDGEGRFVIEGLAEGRYTVKVDRGEGWFVDPVEGVEAGTKNLEIRAYRAVSIKGRVVTSAGLAPEKLYIYSRGAVFVEKTGEFEIRNLRPGKEYSIRVDGRETRAVVEIRAPATGVVITVD